MLLFLTIALPMLGGAAMGTLVPARNPAESTLKPSCWRQASWYVVLLLTRTNCTLCPLPHEQRAGACVACADGMSFSFAGLVSILWPLASLYGFEYMQHEERPNTFFSSYTMSYAVTLAVVLANLFSLYVFCV